LRLAIDFDKWPGVANGGRMTYTLPRWKVRDPEDTEDTELDWGKSTPVDG
jgi:hypothetical protein